ncbi:MAG TPA: hypothetical protein VLB73_04745 [Patescibacteria group bacterium]|nr:hypothetical protein [Patescibacteria group bacterium]
MGRKKTAQDPLNQREREALGKLPPHGQEVAETLRRDNWRQREPVPGNAVNRPSWLPPSRRNGRIEPGPGSGTL